MKKAVALGVVSISILGGLYYFLAPKTPQTNTVLPVASDEVAAKETRPFFDFNYSPPNGWQLWEGVSANMSTFVNLDNVYDPYDVEVMQEYLNTWEPTKTDVLVFLRDADVDVRSRDYMSIVKIANAQADDPLLYDDVRMVLYDKVLNVPKEESVSDIHVRKKLDVADVTADYFRMKNPPSHDSINLSIPYKGQTITFYKSVPKDMGDQEVIGLLLPFIENIPL